MENVTDAKFKVVRPRRRWPFRFDWNNFLIVAAIMAAGLVKTLLGPNLP